MSEFNVDPPFGPVVNGTQVVVFFYYRPNKPAAYTFLVLFGLATLGHLIYLIRLRSWFFIPLILGGIAEVFGYFGRAQASDEPDKVGPFILQNLLLLSAAPLIAATIYMILGRILTALDAGHHSIISPRWMTKLYVLIDIGCLVTQLAGSVLPASGDPSAIKLSRSLIIGGLIVQFTALSIFILTSWHAQHRTKRDPTPVIARHPSINWQNHFRIVQVVTVLVIVRSVVRAVEFIQGDGGFVISHEVFVYLFDALFMFVVMAAFLVLHPGRLIRDTQQAGKEVWRGESMMLVCPRDNIDDGRYNSKLA
ncbi:hypothetical protein jhhlp_005311 [Lomentospora prolificans]|uniref:RTA1 domain protein n=1 Tax=Lomentospora prolificans TaxID=41688 RepID=A0A2N3N7I1_9PEZI|nr:hypothetical protein jhhlp_005311 [Lomentospora prolificans]